MGLPVQRVNKKSGAPACDKPTLEALAAMGEPLPAKISEAREARAKLSQLEKWEEFAKAGEVQCVWNQLGTPHGRYSCEGPNLQNRIVEIRETVEAPEGSVFLSYDLGQAEYVTWGSLSKDPVLIDALTIDGVDFHAKMFEAVKKLVPELPSDEPRKRGKTINFALLYLMQDFTLAKKLGVDIKVARDILQAYDDRATVAAEYKQRMIKSITSSGTSFTHFGRTRELSAIKTAKGGRLHELQKTLWHHHNAGTAAELLKIKQVKTWKEIRRNWDVDEVRLSLQMHDELIFTVKQSVLAEVQEVLLPIMEAAVPGFLPFPIDERAGRNWRDISK